MRLAVRLLVIVGTPLLVIGVANLLLLSAFACYDSGCGSESQLAAAVVERVTGAAPLTILSAVPVTVAWILCIVQFVRTERRGVAVTLALTLPLVAALSLWFFYLTLRTPYRAAGSRFIPAGSPASPRRRCPRQRMFLAAFSSRSKMSPQFVQTCVRTDRLL